MSTVPQVDLSQIGQNGAILPEGPHPLQNKVQLVKEKIDALAKAIEEKAPGFRSLLLEIDKILRSYKELTYMLSEDDIGILTYGLQQDSNTIFAANAEKKKGKGGKDKIQIDNPDEDI